MLHAVLGKTSENHRLFLVSNQRDHPRDQDRLLEDNFGNEGEYSCVARDSGSHNTISRSCNIPRVVIGRETTSHSLRQAYPYALSVQHDNNHVLWLEPLEHFHGAVLPSLPLGMVFQRHLKSVRLTPFPFRQFLTGYG